MYTAESSFVTSVIRLVTKVAARILQKEKHDEFVVWAERTFPATREGSSRLTLNVLAFGSLVLTLLLHAMAYPWVYAIGITLMWFLHEHGHVYMVQSLKLRMRSIIYFPFVGVMMRLAPGELKSKLTEAKVGIAGPVSGLLTTFLLYFAYRNFSPFFPKEMLHDLAIILLLGVVYNFLQMAITVRPFDGGRVAQIIHPLFRPFGIFMMVVISAIFPLSWVAIMWILVLTDMRFAYQWRRLWLIGVIVLGMVTRIPLGYGRAEWWWNAADLVIAWLALSWAWEQAKRDRKSFHSLWEWRQLVKGSKRLLGTWVSRGDDRRHRERRTEPRKESDRRHGERRVALSTHPIDHVGTHPGEFVDRRVQRSWLTPLSKEGARWLLYYVFVQGGLIALGAHMFFNFPSK